MTEHAVGFRLLGSLEVEAEGEVCRLASGPQRVILAALLLRPNQVVSADRLSDLVWDDAPPAGPRRALNNHVMRLRKAVGPLAAGRIRTQAPGYTIDIHLGELDLQQFDETQRAAGEAAEGGDWARAADLLDSALALWRGEALTDVPSKRLHLEVQEHLAERYFQTQQARIDAHLHLGRFDDAIGLARQLIARHPLHERPHCQLMVGLYGSHRQSGALAAFRQIRDILDEELGIEPGKELRELHQAILTQQPVSSLVESVAGPSAATTSASAVLPEPPDIPSLGKATTGSDSHGGESDRHSDNPSATIAAKLVRHLFAAIRFGVVAAALAVLAVGHIPETSAPPPAALTKTAPQPVQRTSSDGKVEYLDRIGYDAQILTTSSVDVPVLHATAGRQVIVVSLTLTATSAGTVTVTDSANNSYSEIGDVVDSYWHRTLLFAAFDAKPLTTSDRISARYPSSSKYHIAVDVFRGVRSVGPQAGSSNTYERRSGEFSTSGTALSCGPGDLMITAIATNSGPAPSFVEGWQTLPELKLSSYRQITSYRFVDNAGRCGATGRTTAQWEAVAVILHR